MKLPISINPCPIVEAVLEVRFKTTVPKSAVFGIFYSKLNGVFEDKPKDLPILQIPEQIRQGDPSFEFKPYYQFKKGNIIVQVGPDVCLISMINNYNGWGTFSEEIYSVLDIIISTGIIKSFLRLGFRYINFFEEEIYNSINVDIRLDNKSIDYDNTVLNTSISHKNFKSNLRISNVSAVNDKRGSIIDIDTYKDISIETQDFKSNYIKLIEEGHFEEKKLFYSLLKEDFLAKLNPKYD